MDDDPDRKALKREQEDVAMDSINDVDAIRGERSHPSSPSIAQQTGSSAQVQGPSNDNTLLPRPQNAIQLPVPTVLPPLPVAGIYGRSGGGSSALGGGGGPPSALGPSVPGTPIPHPGYPGLSGIESGAITPGIAPSGASQAPTSPGSASARPLNVKDALTYLEQVKQMFGDMPDVYNKFLDIMKDFKSQVIDTPGVIERVSTLFVGHPSLIQGFNTFLPAGYRIECTTNAAGATSVTVTTPNGVTTTTPGSAAGMLSGPGRVNHHSSSPMPMQNIPWAPGPGPNNGPGPLPGNLPIYAPGPNGLIQDGSLPSPFIYGPDGSAQIPNSLVINNKATAQPAEFGAAITFVSKIKQRFQHQTETYREFLEILQKYQRDQRPYQEVFRQVSALFKGAPDLIEEFKKFLPDPNAGPQGAIGTGFHQNHPNGGSSSLFGMFGAGAGEVDRLVDSKRKTEKNNEKPGGASGPAGNGGAGVNGAPATPNTNAATTAGGGAKRKKRAHEEKAPPPKPVQQPKPKRTKHHHTKDQSPPYQVPSPVPQHAATNGTHPHSHHHTNGALADAPISSKPAVDEALFFDRVRKFFDDRATYHDFLKLLNLFTQEIIDSRTLVDRARFFFMHGERDRDHDDSGSVSGTGENLLQQFKDILGFDDRGVVLVPDPESSGAFLKGNSSVVSALDRPKVDLNTCKKYGPSYRKLPKEEATLACSGRDAMCWEVLNDEWVSHPTWASEDTGFTTHKKNPYEEALHKSEEERHEYDFHVEAINRTIQILEPINARINLMDNEERTHFKLKPGLGGQGKSIYQRVIKKIYGKDHGAEVINALHESPSIAVPVVLNRLKQKDEEWKRAQREWNKVWREVDGRNYYKSLDHQGVNFKANDKKNYGVKQLVTEIEAKRTEQAKERAKLIDPLFARTMPKDHYAFKLDDAAVLHDCVKLILTFLDRTTTAQYSRSDKIQIESFLHNFVPLFFILDPAEFEAGFPSGDPSTSKASLAASPSVPALRAEDAESEADAASDSQSIVEDGEESGSSKRPPVSSSSKKGAPAHADLRKKLLKSGAQKSGKGASQPPSRASPAPAGESMAVDGEREAFGTPERESWVKYDSADPSAKKASAFKAPVRDVPGRKSNFFANNAIYVLLRQLQILYSRLQMCKSTAQELTEDDSGWQLANPVAVEQGYHDTLGPGYTRLLVSGPNPAKDFYNYTLVCCEQLFDNRMEQATFEDNLRFMYDIRAYLMFTVDKLVGTIVKQIQTVMSDQRSQELIQLLRKERNLDSFTTQQLINYRREAETIVGLDENLYRICWIIPTNVMQIQLLGREDSSTDDATTLTERWRQYIESYTLPHQTEGLPEEVKPPLLRRCLEEHEDEALTLSYISRAKLQIKVCIRTYRLFFLSGTEDFYWRMRPAAEVEATHQKAVERRAQCKDTLAAWLKSKVPEPESSESAPEPKTAEPDVEMAASKEPVAAEVS